MLKQYHDTLVALNPVAAAYTYDMLLEDYTLSFCFWWTAVISLGVDTLPGFDKPAGAHEAAMGQRPGARAARHVQPRLPVPDQAVGRRRP